MKAVHVMLDERLLEELDATDEVRERGRSAVLRVALQAYLRRRRHARIAEAHMRAYIASAGLGDQWTGSEEQGIWPGEQQGRNLALYVRPA